LRFNFLSFVSLSIFIKQFVWTNSIAKQFIFSHCLNFFNALLLSQWKNFLNFVFFDEIYISVYSIFILCIIKRISLPWWWSKGERQGRRRNRWARVTWTWAWGSCATSGPRVNFTNVLWTAFTHKDPKDA